MNLAVLIASLISSAAFPKNNNIQWIPPGPNQVLAGVPGGYGARKVIVLETPGHYWIDPDCSFNELLTIRF